MAGEYTDSSAGPLPQNNADMKLSAPALDVPTYSRRRGPNPAINEPRIPDRRPPLPPPVFVSDTDTGQQTTSLRRSRHKSQQQLPTTTRTHHHPGQRIRSPLYLPSRPSHPPRLAAHPIPRPGQHPAPDLAVPVPSEPVTASPARAARPAPRRRARRAGRVAQRRRLPRARDAARRRGEGVC